MNLSKSAIVAAEFAVGLSITTVSNAATNSGSKNSGNNYVYTSIPDQGYRSMHRPFLSTAFTVLFPNTQVSTVAWDKHSGNWQLAPVGSARCWSLSGA